MEWIGEDECFGAAQATRAAFLVDGSTYFAALHDALSRATRRVTILGWDLHTDLALLPGSEASAPLSAALAEAVERSSDLMVQVAIWKAPAPIRLERQWWPGRRLRGRLGERVAFRHLTARAPGGAHHHKLVVVDDALAFVGGIDLTSGRWDRRAHAHEDGGRVDPWGHDYDPWHDAHLLVGGPLAGVLADYARTFWERETGEPLPALDPLAYDPWPKRLEASLRDVPAAVVRTIGAAPGVDEPVREIERCYREVIARARRWIYLENQYLASSRIVDWLEARLDEPGGPEIVIVLAGSCEGWLDSLVMGSKRAHLVKRLRRHPAAGSRLRIYEPRRAGGDDSLPIYVHAKVAIIDRDCVVLGSANLANRSMGLDTELDVVLDTRDSAAGGALLDELLAEHLDTTPTEIAERIERTGSLIETIEQARGGERSLEPIVADEGDPLDYETADTLDPERPVPVGLLLRRLATAPGPARRRIGVGVALALGALLGVAASAGWWLTH